MRYFRPILLFPFLFAVQACTVLQGLLPGKAERPAAPERPVLKVEATYADSLLADFEIVGYPRTQSNWVDSVYETLSLRGRMGQLITVFSFSDASERNITRLLRTVQGDSIGGVIVSRGNSAALRTLVDTLTRSSRIPLLISADFETGPGMRLTDGFRIPSMMAMAAASSPDLAYQAGRAVAYESLQLGVAQNYAPVADINNNHLNPIINTRSFGEDRELVAKMAEAYMRGLQDGGMIATAKHFPGHGDTQVDSHSALPLLAFDRVRLDSLELYPFRRLVQAGVMSVMPGHLAVPALTGDSSLPATLSRVLIDSLLRGEWDFAGLVVSDAMNMKALTRTRGHNIPATALNAGIDVLLMPENPAATIDSLLAAFHRAELDTAVVERAVKRILAMKQWAGAQAPGDDDEMTEEQRRDKHRELSYTIAKRAVTLLGNQNNILPLSLLGKRIGVVSMTRDESAPGPAAFSRLLQAGGAQVTLLNVAARTSLNAAAIRDSMKNMDVLIIAGFIAVVNGSGSIGVSASQRSALGVLGDLRKPVILCSFGSPYFAAQYAKADAWICAYGDDDASLRATVDLLRGDIPSRGRLPVSIPGIANIGDGLRLRDATVAVSQEYDPRFSTVDALIQEKIDERAFPGAQLLVRLSDGSVYQRCYGTYSYEAGSPRVHDSTLYDIASLTKVVATTSAIMRLYEEGLLHLDSAAASYLPEFGANGKDAVTIRQLLQHRGGLEAFRQFHPRAENSDEVLRSIYASPLLHEPGSRTLYSDFGMIVLAKLVEQLSGSSFDEYVHQTLLEPLKMRHTMFLPPDTLRTRIAPTEMDGTWRKRLLQGEVHDETASLLGGVAGHAGLFSTATDLGLFAEMFLHLGGTPDTQLFKPATIQYFTARQHARDVRALGWDLRSAAGSSSGRYFSMRSYGHTGFTGTSIWIDPSANMYVVFLTNRVHPTRANKSLPRFRAQLHDAIREVMTRQVN
jgi:beta-N-acetylhexosaminidase